MIAVADLLTNNRVPGNYFATDSYVRSELELGILESRRGDRLLALPETLIQGIYGGLLKETGQASRMVLYNCGGWWGKAFYTRFREEIMDYYGTPLAEMRFVDFLVCLKQWWRTCGWGRLDLDATYQQRGFLIVKTWESPFAAEAPESQTPVCHLEAGIFANFFGQLTGRDLQCVQIACESQGLDHNQFLLGLPNRVGPAEEMVENQMSAADIMAKLTV